MNIDQRIVRQIVTAVIEVLVSIYISSKKKRMK